MRKVLKIVGVVVASLVVVLMGLGWYQMGLRSLPRDAATTVTTPEYVFETPTTPARWVTGCERFEPRCIAAVPFTDDNYSWWNRREWIEVVPVESASAATSSGFVKEAREAAARTFGVKPEEMTIGKPDFVESDGAAFATFMAPASQRYGVARAVRIPGPRVLAFVCHIEETGDSQSHVDACNAAFDSLRFPTAEAFAREQESAQRGAEEKPAAAAAAKPEFDYKKTMAKLQSSLNALDKRTQEDNQRAFKGTGLYVVTGATTLSIEAGPFESTASCEAGVKREAAMRDIDLSTANVVGVRCEYLTVQDECEAIRARFPDTHCTQFGAER